MTRNETFLRLTAGYILRDHRRNEDISELKYT